MEEAAVVGYGMVGRATAAAFGIGKYFDLRGSNCTLEDIARLRYVFLCLPTPTVNGVCQREPIVDMVKQIAGYGSHPIFINRSTVTPGTAKYIIEQTGVPTIVSCPEFLSEDTATADAKRPWLVVIGAELAKYGDVVEGIYEAHRKGLNIIRTDTVTAETIKYAMNTFFATKVMYANAMYDICQSNGANYEAVRKSLETTPWGTKNHLDVWHKGGRGAGGHCLGKDLDAFTGYSQHKFFQFINEENKRLLTEYPKKGIAKPTT